MKRLSRFSITHRAGSTRFVPSPPILEAGKHEYRYTGSHGRPRPKVTAQSFVTFTVAGQLFGVPVTRVQDILTPDAIAPVPGGPDGSARPDQSARPHRHRDRRAHPSVAAQGQRRNRQARHVRDGREPAATPTPCSWIRWATSSRLSRASCAKAIPATLDAVWREVADAVYRTDQGLLVALDVDRLLAIDTKA